MRRSAWALLGLLLGVALLAGVAAASPSRAGAAALDPTNIQTAAPTSLVAGGQTTLSATLLDSATNAAVPGERLNFTERTTFGALLLGGAVTDARGVARVSYSPAYAGNYSIHVTFGGDSAYAPANATFAFIVTTAGSAPPPAISPDTVVVLVIVAVIGGVWTTYGLVAWLIVGIRADRPEAEGRGASAEATASEGNDTMEEEASEERMAARESASRASKLANRNTVIVAGLTLMLGIALGIGVGNAFHGSAAPAANPPTEHLYLTIAFDPATGLDEIFPANFSVPAGVPVTITITNYDNGTNPVSSADAQVSGTVGGSESVQLWGQAAQNVTSVDVARVSHTFTILESPYSLNVPVPASTNLAQPTMVTFTAVFGTAGTFTWRCMTPCDGVAMVTPGFMQGTLTVA